METLYYSPIESPVGRLVVGVSERGLAMLHFAREDFPPPPPATRAARHALGLPTWATRVTWERSEQKTRPYVRELREYFAGRRRRFTFPLDLRGTEFQKRCWQALCRIPYGATCSYADVAREVGSPRAFRAVGMANHYNPVAIIVPCHRVVASDGTLGGYGGGLRTKQTLLDLERAAPGRSRGASA